MANSPHLPIACAPRSPSVFPTFLTIETFQGRGVRETGDFRICVEQAERPLSRLIENGGNHQAISGVGAACGPGHWQDYQPRTQYGVTCKRNVAIRLRSGRLAITRWRHGMGAITSIDNPILNSPYKEPTRHFRFDANNQITSTSSTPGGGAAATSCRSPRRRRRAPPGLFDALEEKKDRERPRQPHPAVW